MTYPVKVIADTLNPYTKTRITTFQLTYPRFIHSELMTHRVFSRNASSSRAIPVSKILRQVWSDPAMPSRFGTNIPGMQAGTNLTGARRWIAEKLWRASAKVACVFAWGMMKAGLHKQWSNRILEPWQYIHVVVTATEWDNFYELRNHEDAQPEFKILAAEIKKQHDLSTPVTELYHIPYVTKEERRDNTVATLIKMSVARCARVSYLTHDGKTPDIKKDLELYNRLVGSRPIHASPTEHQAKAVKAPGFIKNFRSWRQHRVDVEKSFGI